VLQVFGPTTWRTAPDRFMAYESPQMRRLRSDLAAMERLAEESSVLAFRASGRPTQRYLIEFRGRSLARERGKVTTRDHHEVEIKFGASYPRTMPELRWLSPIYHPNISEIGLVCLGGNGTHWVPSLHLDDLCVMLWDMARYHNYDIRSPYNREAALWAANQSTFAFPTDSRPLRDKRVALGRVEEPGRPRPLASAPLEKTAEPKTAATGGENGKEEPIQICILDLELELPPPIAHSRPVEQEVIFLD
jgi:ubiquitin-protein ligase